MAKQHTCKAERTKSSVAASPGGVCHNPISHSGLWCSELGYTGDVAVMNIHQVNHSSLPNSSADAYMQNMDAEENHHHNTQAFFCGQFAHSPSSGVGFLQFPPSPSTGMESGCNQTVIFTQLHADVEESEIPVPL